MAEKALPQWEEPIEEAEATWLMAEIATPEADTPQCPTYPTEVAGRSAATLERFVL